MNILLFSLVFDVLKYAIDSVFLGVLFTVLGVGLLFLLIKGFYTKKTFTPLSIIVGGVLFVLLSFQSIFICGAFKIKGMTDEMEGKINQYVSTAWGNLDHEFTKEDSQQIIEELMNNYPLFACYVGSADFSGHNVDEIAKAMIDKVHTFLNNYIWRRVAWCFFYILLGTVIVLKTMSVQFAVINRKRSSAVQRRRKNDF